ncbi:MAG TPA: hypothetical protein VNV36_06130 [Pseudomonas sp.]|uniref:hypothetical protein n=1 Tax=Pseudomonas sp. TaxID=306 RepID=UPI002D0C08AD|nr:hypothetical protein [Pseudomonas sp.]HWH86333.1 hypothetical protein [Pseudomonas sp.]
MSLISQANPQESTPPPKLRLEWYGVERYCVHCREYWPADNEFFRVRADDGKFSSWCRACEYEARNNKRRVKR